MTASKEEFKRVKRHKQEHPSGWEPGVQWNPDKGGTLTVIADSEPDSSIWLNLIEDWELDPTKVSVVPGSVQVRAWDANMGDGVVQRFKYYRATLKPFDSPEADARADIDELIKLVDKRKPAKATLSLPGDRSFVAFLADWQLGNGEAGGSEQIAQQILDGLDRTITKAKQLRKVGRGANTAYLLGLGDIVEGCKGWYEMQTYSVDLNNREQDRLARHLLLQWVDAFVDEQFEVVAVGCAGNHGEQRDGSGKAYTSFDDNRDVQVFEILAEIMAQNPARYGNVSVPLEATDQYDLTVTLDISGVPLSIAHGHQFGNGQGSTINKIENWLKGQALGRQAVADCEILVSGHFHHFLASEATGRQVFQAPASDAGSAWFTSRTGKGAFHGVLSMNVGASTSNRGWSDLDVL